MKLEHEDVPSFPQAKRVGNHYSDRFRTFILRSTPENGSRNDIFGSMTKGGYSRLNVNPESSNII